MGVRVVDFNDAHPDTDAGFQVVAEQLKAVVSQGKELIALQRDGLMESHASRIRKQELERELLTVPIAHLGTVGRRAARENHELANLFRFRPPSGTFLAFRTAAASMLAAAQANRELLVKYGLAESVLDELARLLGEFDAAMKLGADGRIKHRSATRGLQAVAREIVQTVQVMDGRNRHRFKNDPTVLAGWLSAKVVLGMRRSLPPPGTTGAPPAGERPAA